MKINPINNNNLSFSSQFITKVPVMKYCAAEKIYKSAEADLVKFEQKIPKDINFIKKVCENSNFNLLGTYLLRLCQEKSWNFPYMKSNSVYVLLDSKESQDYNKANPDDILGITEFVESNEAENPNKIMYLITNKKYQYYNKNDIAEFKNVGHGISETLKALYPQKPIGIFSLYESVEFWQKQGYKKVADRQFIYNG